MEKGYTPKGWLGLLLGTRLYYSFYEAEGDDEPTFEKRVDALVREIGDRGMQHHLSVRGSGGALVSEGVPPSSPALQLASAVAAATATATGAAASATPPRAEQQVAATPLRRGGGTATSTSTTSSSSNRGFTPSMRLDEVPTEMMTAAAAAAMSPLLMTTTSEVENVSLVERLLQQQREFMLLQREHEEQVRAKLTAQLSTLSAAATAKSNAQIERLTQEQDLTALQLRLEGLHSAKLLTDAELYALEDMIGDSISQQQQQRQQQQHQQQQQCGGGASAGTVVTQQVDNMVGLSKGIASDGALSRQLRRALVS